MKRNGYWKIKGSDGFKRISHKTSNLPLPEDIDAFKQEYIVPKKVVKE